MTLDPTLVEQYTKGRLDASEDESKRLVAAALAAARRWCGWHVTPVKAGDVVTIDGRGGRMLRLPTMKLVSLTGLVEDGTAVDLSGLRVSQLGMVSKKSGAFWSCHFGAIQATMTHGYADAPDFDAAVLSLIDRESFLSAGGRARVVGPFQWESGDTVIGGFTTAELAKLEQFRLERPA